MFTLPRRGRYSGRLAFDPDTGFHVDDKGRRVVTLDAGKTWQYATRVDTSHNARYQTRVAELKATGTLLVELTAEHGPDEAHRIVTAEQPHHYAVQSDDAHAAAVLSDPDPVAATVTSHTEAYA